MEYSVVHWINEVMHAHPLLASVVVQFSTWGIPIFGVLAVGLWVLSPPGDTAWKRACTAGLSAAAVGLAANQALSHVWDRARPYEAHASIVPLLPRSGDPSFPSDHATAALSIAFGVFFVSRRAGWFFLAFAIVVASSRVVAGMHYPTDVLGSLAVSVAAGYFTARIAMQRVLFPLIRLVSRLTDPVLAHVTYFEPVRRTVLQPRVRLAVVTIACLVVEAEIISSQRTHLLDEMPLGVIAAWLAVAALALYLSSLRFWRSSRLTTPT